MLNPNKFSRTFLERLCSFLHLIKFQLYMGGSGGVSCRCTAHALPLSQTQHDSRVCVCVCSTSDMSSPRMSGSDLLLLTLSRSIRPCYCSSDQALPLVFLTHDNTQAAISPSNLFYNPSITINLQHCSGTKIYIFILTQEFSVMSCK